MQADKIAKFVNSIVRFVDFFPEPGKYLLGLVTEKLYQDIILIFEIKIDRTISDTGFPGDLRNGWLEKTLFRKYFDCRFKDPMIFVVYFLFSANNRPLSNFYAYEWILIH